MQPLRPQEKILAHGYPGMLGELGKLADPVEPCLVLCLYGLLRSAGLPIDYSEADVISGRATQFLYHKDYPECMNIAFAPPLDTLFKAVGVRWKEVTPSGAETAFGILKQWISEGHIALARLKEPMLVYGFEESGLEQFIWCARSGSRLREERISVVDCDAKYWRYPIDEGNVLVLIESVPKRMPAVNVITLSAVRRAVTGWHSGKLAGCSSGEEAYEDFAEDLRNPETDFTENFRSAWMGTALWTQWTARYSARRFFERVAPQFGGSRRNAMGKAAFYYGQCVGSWSKFAQILGPSRNFETVGFEEGYSAEFLNRWSNMQLRFKAAEHVNEAKEWEAKAVKELTKILG